MKLQYFEDARIKLILHRSAILVHCVCLPINRVLRGAFLEDDDKLWT